MSVNKCRFCRYRCLNGENIPCCFCNKEFNKFEEYDINEGFVRYDEED